MTNLLQKVPRLVLAFRTSLCNSTNRCELRMSIHKTRQHFGVRCNALLSGNNLSAVEARRV